MEKVIGIEVKGEIYRIEDEETSGKAQTLETKVSAVESNIETLETITTEQATKVAQIESNIGETNISELKATVDSHSDELTEIFEDLPKVKSSVKELTPALLWTNPNPNASFAAQIINLNLADYKKIKITYRDAIQPINNQYSAEGEFIDGSLALNLQTLYVDWGDDILYIQSRVAKINKLQVSFETPTYWIQDSEGGRDGQDNRYSVPLKIYGYK